MDCIIPLVASSLSLYMCMTAYLTPGCIAISTAALGADLLHPPRTAGTSSKITPGQYSRTVLTEFDLISFRMTTSGRYLAMSSRISLPVPRSPSIFHWRILTIPKGGWWPLRSFNVGSFVYITCTVSISMDSVSRHSCGRGCRALSRYSRGRLWLLLAFFPPDVSCLFSCSLSSSILSGCCTFLKFSLHSSSSFTSLARFAPVACILTAFADRFHRSATWRAWSDCIIFRSSPLLGLLVVSCRGSYSRDILLLPSFFIAVRNSASNVRSQVICTTELCFLPYLLYERRMRR